MWATEKLTFSTGWKEGVEKFWGRVMGCLMRLQEIYSQTISMLYSTWKHNARHTCYCTRNLFWHSTFFIPEKILLEPF